MIILFNDALYIVYIRGVVLLFVSRKSNFIYLYLLFLLGQGVLFKLKSQLFGHFP